MEKLMVSPEQKEIIETETAFSFGSVMWAFNSGVLGEEKIEHAHETHLCYLDNVVKLGLMSDDEFLNTPISFQ